MVVRLYLLERVVECVVRVSRSSDKKTHVHYVCKLLIYGHKICTAGHRCIHCGYADRFTPVLTYFSRSHRSKCTLTRLAQILTAAYRHLQTCVHRPNERSPYNKN